MSSAKWNQRYREDAADWPAEPSPALMEIADRLQAGRALDLACGTGRNALYLARCRWAVTGVDFAEEALKIARKRSHQEDLSVAWVHADIEHWMPAPDTFDLVLICYLHIPWDAFARVIHTAERALRPGGSLVIIGHDRENVTEGTGKPKHPDVTYTAEEIADALCCSSPLRIEQQRRSPDHGVADQTDAIQIDCVVHAKKN